MFEEFRAKRPLKLWNCWRNVRKGLAVGSFKELLDKGKEKFEIPATESVRVVLESDGTQIDDGEYFHRLENNTVLIILREEERWQPIGIDKPRAAIKGLPRFLCEQIISYNIQDEIPLCKILRSNDQLTVLMHWNRSEGEDGDSLKGSSVSDRHARFQETQPDSSESEDTIMTDDSAAMDLVLIDKLSEFKKHHLNDDKVREIFHQLKEKIPRVIDINLFRESDDAFLWIITAHVRGGKWENEGVTYQQNYYPIKRHFFPRKS